MHRWHFLAIVGHREEWRMDKEGDNDSSCQLPSDLKYLRKTQTKYMKQQFSRYWISKKEGQWSLRDEKQMRYVLRLPPLYCPESSQATLQAGGAQAEPSGALSWGDGGGMPQWLEFIGQWLETRGLYINRELWRSAEGSLCIFLWLSSNQNIYVKKQPQTKEREKIRGGNSWSSHKAGNVFWLQEPAWKTSEFMGPWVKYQKGFCLICEAEFAVE